MISNTLFTRAADNDDDTKGVSLSPPIMEISVDPGDVVNKQIKLSNPLNHAVRMYPLVYDFLAMGEEGQQTFLPATSESRDFSLASWISYSRSVVSLASNEEDILDFKIIIPKSAEPGGHYGVIFFSTDAAGAQAQPGQISVSGMVGSLILVRVSGDIVEKAEIIEFSAPRWSLNGPIKFITRIENLGNVHFKPRGSINISNWRGENIESFDLNPLTGNVLPESIRRFESEWKNQGRWGRFTAKVSATYGTEKQKLESELVFWIIPIYILIILGLILAILVIFIVWLIRRRNKPKQIHKNNQTENNPPRAVRQMGIARKD
ncbi:MAG: hypothetical protein ABH837_00820 [bacterium]